MIGAVNILAICEDTEICSSIHTSLESAGHNPVCVSSPLEALHLLQRGFAASFLLIHATKHDSKDSLFAPSLLQNINRERVAILSEVGDSSWDRHTEKWNITTILTMPLATHDINKLTSRFHMDTVTSAKLTIDPSAKVPCFHMEDLDNNRFFMAASPTMMQLYRNIRVLAPVDIPVLILGESGVGKEIVAMLLHKYHANPEKKLLSINCAALPTELLESELFGYEAGAFTGATRSKPGMFELADNGTLLLDEIGEMSPQMQAKLLHVLQDGSFCRLGARSSSRVNVRVLAATNINMQDAIAEK